VPENIPADLEAALADRYQLRRLLGRGGMASVYLAHDQKHQREVALKVLLPGLAELIGVERFLNEIQIVARLTHPHILAMHDSGEAGGFLYYVMPYIEGGSLRQRLGGRTLLPEEAFAIATPVADALSYAHRMGILHRDIKPENILFSQGHPIVADFGIAKAISTAGGANLTRTGFPLGTPGYMSPEQAAGLTDLDARTDVYSLAIVTYEMLVGEPPGRWPTEDAVRTGSFLEASSAHRSRLSQVGSRIEGALVHALAVRLDQRTPTPAVLIDELTGAATPAAAHRRFSGGEVQEIVKRASEIEASNPTAGSAMTIGGVEALAAEVGIAPETVREAAESIQRPAADEVDGGDRSRYNRFLGAPTRVFIERVLDGELPESEYAVLVDEARRIMRNVGQVSQLGRSFSWVANPGAAGRSLAVVVSIRGGHTRITIQENLTPLVGAIYGGVGGGMGGGGIGPILGISMGALHLPGAALGLIIPAWLATTLATAHIAYRRTAKGRVRELEQLADRLAALARDLIPPERPALRRPERPALP